VETSVSPTEKPKQKIQENPDEKPVPTSNEPKKEEILNEENPAYYRSSKPLQNSENRKSSFNLKTIFDKVEEEKPVIEKKENLPEEPFSEEDLLAVWNEFLTQLQTRNKIPVYNALHTGKISKLEKFQILFEFNSASLINEFDLQKEELMKLMREKLNNHSLEFLTKINRETAQNFVKTKAEIFNEMVKKNPILLKMKEEMGLDFNSNE
jgi:DNA polymerase-3 subunit gamma/tau